MMLLGYIRVGIRLLFGRVGIETSVQSRSSVEDIRRPRVAIRPLALRAWLG